MVLHLADVLYFNGCLSYLIFMKSLIFLLLFNPFILIGQFDFEKYKAIKYNAYSDWKIQEDDNKAVSTIELKDFLKKKENIKLQLTSFKEHFFENSEIKIFINNLEKYKIIENMMFNPISLDSLRIMDINNDGLNDIKIIAAYMGNGTASMNVKVIYLIQQANNKFLKISFDDKQSENRIERDFNGDNIFEIITMSLLQYKKHSYWNFNLFNIQKNKLINMNKKNNYPILVQFLEKENYVITSKISRKEMKKFELKVPQGIDIQIIK